MEKTASEPAGKLEWRYANGENCQRAMIERRVKEGKDSGIGRG